MPRCSLHFSLGLYGQTIHTHIRIYIYIIHTYIYVYTCMYVSMCIYTYTYIHICIHIDLVLISDQPKKPRQRVDSSVQIRGRCRNTKPEAPTKGSNQRAVAKHARSG